MVFNCRSLLNAAADLAALRRLRSPFAIRDANSKQRQKYMKQNHLLLWISPFNDCEWRVKPCGRTSFQTRSTGICRAMISEWRRQSKRAGLWQYQTFSHGPILYWTAKCELKTMNNSFSFSLRGYYGLFGGATCGVSVWNGGLTESTASVHYLHRVLD